MKVIESSTKILIRYEVTPVSVIKMMAAGKNFSEELVERQETRKVK